MAVVMSSCSYKVHRNDFKEYTHFLDYSEYTQRGFFITESNTAPFDYVGIGSVEISQYDGDVRDKQNASEKANIREVEYDAIYGLAGTKKGKATFVEATYESSLQSVYEFAKSKGADGIICLELSPILNNDPKYTYQTGVRISGMLIKRK